jgi:hypothetical protein
VAALYAREQPVGASGLKGKPFGREHDLSMDEIDIREEICVLGEVPAGSKRRMAIDGAVVPIARFCDVKTWHAKRAHESAVYCSYGFEPDVAMALSRALPPPGQGRTSQAPRQASPEPRLCRRDHPNRRLTIRLFLCRG